MIGASFAKNILHLIPAPLRSRIIAVRVHKQDRRLEAARAALAAQFVSGMGLEVGPGARPFPIPSGVVCRYGDIRDKVSLQRYFSTDVVFGDHFIDAQTFAGIPDSSVDFVISAHVIEHLEDPIGAIKNALRVLRPGGVLLVVVPDRRHTFDRLRPGTTLSHVLQDYEDGGISTRREGHLDHARYVHPALAGETLSDVEIQDSADRTMKAGMDIHIHCWSIDEFIELLEFCCQRFGAKIEAARGVIGHENHFVLRALRTT